MAKSKSPAQGEQPKAITKAAARPPLGRAEPPDNSPPHAVAIEGGPNFLVAFAEELIDLISDPLPTARGRAERTAALECLSRAHAIWTGREELGMRVVRDAINLLEDARVPLDSFHEDRKTLIAREAHRAACAVALGDRDALGRIPVDAWATAIDAWEGYKPRDRYGYDWARVVHALLASADLTGAYDAKNLADTFYRAHEKPAPDQGGQ